MRDVETLRRDALAIWQAGVDAVRSDRLVEEHLSCADGLLRAADVTIPLADLGRIEIVGAGKAGAGMSAGALRALAPAIAAGKSVSGWLNVPADCVQPLDHIHLHAARPAGVNEPTAAGVAGAEEILRRVAALGPRDVCLALISGGGSALLPAPAPGISLDDKLTVTRWLSAAGANIAELNTVRKQLSRIKGGGLLRACRAGWLITLVISDVLGDPLDLIASGPTIENPDRGEGALDVMLRFDGAKKLPHIVDWLRARLQAPASDAPTCRATTTVIGNNATAVDAAGVEADRRGYSMALSSAAAPEGAAEEVGRHLAAMAQQMRSGTGVDCLISGGEPTVRLAPPELRGRGGRNQQLVLAALESLAAEPRGIVILSGGTDGEDGPTDAAGAVLDERLIASARQRQLDWHDYLRRNDAYRFFEPLGGLIKTGPTHTNVCDLRVVLVAK